MLPRPTTANPTFLCAVMKVKIDVKILVPPLTFAIGPAQPLVANGLMVQGTQFFNVLENFVDRVGNRIDILPAAQEKLMHEPHCLVISSSVRLHAGIHTAQIERLIASPTQRG